MSKLIIILATTMLVLFLRNQTNTSDSPGDRDSGGVFSMAEAITC